MELFKSLEDMVRVLEIYVQNGAKIKMWLKHDWTIEIHACEVDCQDSIQYYCKFNGLRYDFPLCVQEEEKFQLINQLKGENWIQDLGDAINSGDTTEHLKRILKLESFK